MKSNLSIFWRFSFLPYLLALSACGASYMSDDLLIIPVDVTQNTPVRLSEISDNVKKIELETSEKCIIGRIAQVVYDDDRIFVLDAQGGSRIHVFDIKGKFLFAIDRQGRGPGEYMYIVRITADIENKYIYILNAMGRKIIRYDWDGRFIDEFMVTGFPEWVYFGNDLLHIFFVDYRPIGDRNFAKSTFMVRYNSDWLPVDTTFVKEVILKEEFGYIDTRTNPISQDNRKNTFIYYHVLFPDIVMLDTLYMLDNNKLKPYAKLQFSDENKSVRNKSVYSILHTSNLIIAEYFSYSDRKLKFFCYDFESNIGKNMAGGFLDDVFDSGIVEIRLLNNQYFYFIVEAEYDPDLLIEPNPVLYIGRFKE